MDEVMGNPLDYFEMRGGRDSVLRDILKDLSFKGKVDKKLEKAAPYNFFLTRVGASFDTYFEDLTISFPELLDQSLGILEHSIHINYMVDFSWLLSQYGMMDLVFSPMTVICGVDEEDSLASRGDINIKTIIVQPNFRYGKMHAKMSIFFYTDLSCRFVIYTANLTHADWSNLTQGVWISPRCPYMDDGVPINYGESVTLFKRDIIHFLSSYDVDDLGPWIVRIQRCDLSAIRVCLVTSVPGEHQGDNYGYKKLNSLLKENVLLPSFGEWDFVAQCSSIGSLGPKPQSWLETFSRSLLGNSTFGAYIPIKIIYPSLNNVKKSHDGLAGCHCLPYSKRIHKNQTWVRSHLYQWKSEHRHRTAAIPHIKTYAKLSKDGTKLGWFLLTSANLSKAAWGMEKPNNRFLILSYELGVLFLPIYFNHGDVFTIRKGGDVDENKELFPLPYDAPLTQYENDDEIYLVDCFFS